MCGAFYFPQNHLIQFHWFYFLIKSCYILNYLSTDSDNGTYSCFHMWFFKMYLFLNWRIIALQNCVGFCQTSPWMSHAAKSLQSCPTLCDPMDCSLPGFSVHGILQAKTLEWVVISFSNAWKWKVKVKSLSHVWLFATPWTAAYQAPPSMGFSRQQYWSGLPLSSPWMSHRYRYVPSFLNLPPHLTSLGCYRAPLSSLSHTANSHWPSILHMVM